MSYHDMQIISNGNQCRVVGQYFCTVNYRLSESPPQTFPHTGRGTGIEPTPAEASVLPLQRRLYYHCTTGAPILLLKLQ